MPHRSQQSDVIWEKVRNPNCKACSLHTDAQTVCLLGDGPVECAGLVLGEAPGYREDEIEIPFAGKSGLFLRRCLKEIGLDPRTLYITNTVACKPLGNRPPTTKEIKTCSQLYLLPQIMKVNPRAILLLGNSAVTWARGKKAAVTKLEGSTFVLQSTRQLGLFDNGQEITCVPSRHPSSVIRAEGSSEYPFLVQKFKENLILFKRTLFPIPDEFKFRKELPFLNGDIPYVYTDLESNGLNPFKSDAKIHCIGFAQENDKISSCPIENNKKHRNHIITILKSYPIMAHRATFEGTWFLWHYGITPRIYHDTKVCAYIINENEPSGLKHQAISHLGVEPWSEEMDFTNPNFDKMLPYNARDNAYGLRLYRERDLPFLKKNPKVARLLRYIVYPSIEVFIEIICNGFHIDEKAATKKLTHCETEKAKLSAKLNKIAGYDVNPGSPKQMSKLFYQQLRLECPVKTAKGADSTSEAALIRLRGRHEATDILWEWRGWDKKKSTYLEPWIRQGPVLHALYGHTGTDTGRLNSTMVKDKRGEKKTGGVLHQCPRDPFIRNLITPRGHLPVYGWHHTQNIRPDNHSKPLFLPNNPTISTLKKHPEDWCVVSVDLSQIELRLVAHCANEPTMIDIFNSGGDIHTATALDVLKCAIEAITKEIRKKAKAVNFGFVYGMFAPKFQAYCLEKFDLKLTLQESKEYRRGYFRKYSGLTSWHNRVEAFVRVNGWIDSIFGRRRHLPFAMDGVSADEWIQREAIRQGINSPIQGAGSDLLLLILALIASYSMSWKFKIDRQKAFPIGSAHDSMIFECLKTYAKELKEGILWTVASLPLKERFGIEMRVPILADVDVYEKQWEGEKLEI